MTELTSSLNWVQTRVQDLSATRKALIELLKNAKEFGFSLEDRWELYLAGESLLEIHPFISKSIRVLTDAIYNDIGIERYEQLLNSGMDERITENYNPEDTDEFSEIWAQMYAKRDEWREAVLAEGYAGFTFDW